MSQLEVSTSLNSDLRLLESYYVILSSRRINLQIAVLLIGRVLLYVGRVANFILIYVHYSLLIVRIAYSCTNCLDPRGVVAAP